MAKKRGSDRYAIISDLQVPYHHPLAFEFVKQVVKEFKIQKDNILNAGDEVDQYWGGAWAKDIEASHTCLQEIEASKEELRRWYKQWPKMRIAQSNHGDRWLRKAMAAEIPSQMIRKYQDIMEMPEGWEHKKHWRIEGSKKPFIVEHLDDYGTMLPAEKAAMHNGISTCGGHHHCKLQVTHFKTNYLELWSAVAGSLIDFESHAYKYARKAARKPKLGMLVVLDGGTMPIPVPFESL